MKKAAKTWGFWLVVAVVALLLRVLVGGWNECRRAEAELDEDRPYQAVLHYERAVRWYLPGSPYVTRAARALWDLGEQAQAAGDDELALFAYRGLRASAYATRSFYQPLPRRIADAEVRITELMVANPDASWPDRTLSREERHRIIAENLQDHRDPRTGWVVVLELGFVVWVAGTFVLTWTIGRKRGRRTTVLLVSGIVVGYVLWIIGMWRA